MKLIKSSYEILHQDPGLKGVYKQIERCGRLCYKSENLISENSYKKFFEMIKERQHLSVTEHGTVYLMIPYESNQEGLGSYFWDEYDYCWYHPETIKYKNNSYSKVRQDKDNNYYITSNLRVLIENGWEDDLKYLCEPTEFHEKRYCVKMTIPIGISREFNRHRAFSISESSTRYCNYSLDKFGNEITYIQPTWFKNNLTGNKYSGRLSILSQTPVTGYSDGEELFLHGLLYAEKYYFDMLNIGFKPQSARDILSLNTATEVVYTAFASDWSHFFSLRCDKGAHPDARAIAIPLYEEFVEKGYITPIK